MIKDIRDFINKNINPLVQQLTAATNENHNQQITTLQQQLLNENVELSKKLSSLMNGNQDVGNMIDSYLLEGLTGTYLSMPKPKEDLLTADHQPQASILEWAAKQQYFKKSQNIQNRAKDRANNGYAINLYENRHKAGRTFGNKGRQTKDNFVNNVQDQFSKIRKNILADDQKRDKTKREIVVELIKNELKQDVEAINTIATNDQYSDIDALQISDREKKKLKDTIKNNILAGEQQILNQDLDSLKN
jgi:hypothetical protein